MLENVTEFKDWGPLNEAGQPIKAKSGETFQAFVQALSTGLDPSHPAVAEIVLALGDKFPLQHIYNGLGYKVEFKELRASDFGAPTIRKRLFLVARRDGQPIVWPVPTHGDPKKKDFVSSGLLPWKTAADCIDWEEPTKSIFDRKKPLALNTIHTDKPLTALSPEDVAAINKSVSEGQSWHAFQQHKKQADIIKGHEAEIAQLKQDVADAKQAAKWESDLCEQALADMKKHELLCKEAQRIATDLFGELKDPNSIAGDAYVEYFERVTGVSIEPISGISVTE